MPQPTNSSMVYVCPGPADEEGCTFWLTAPGWCPMHPHVDLVQKPLAQTTIPRGGNDVAS